MNNHKNTFASEETLESPQTAIQSALEVADYLWVLGYTCILAIKFNLGPWKGILEL